MPTYTDNLITRVAMEGVARMRSNQKEIGAGFKALSGDIKGASGMLGKLDDHQGAVVGIGAGLAAAGAGMAAYMRIAVDAAAQSAEVEARLQTALEASGKARGGAARSILEYSQALQSQTTFDDEAIANSAAMLASFKMNEQEIKAYLPRVLDIAAGMKKLGKEEMSLEQVAIMLGKGHMGMATGLRKVGIDIDMTAYKQDRLKAITTEVDAEFKGQAKTAAQVGGGPMKQFANSVDDLNESMGQGLLPLLQKFNSVATPVARAMTAANEATGGWAGGAVALAAGIGLAGGACLLAAPGVLALVNLYRQLAVNATAAAAAQTVAGNAAVTAGAKSAAGAAIGSAGAAAGGGILGKVGGALSLGGRLNWKGIGKGLGVGTVLSLAGGIAGAQGAAGKTELEESGGKKGVGKYIAGSIGGGALSGAAYGAMIGSVIPGLGTAVGAIAGGAIGAAATAFGKRKEIKELGELRRGAADKNAGPGASDSPAVRSAAGIEQLVDLMAKQNRIISGGGDRAKAYLPEADIRRFMYKTLGSVIA